MRAPAEVRTRAFVELEGRVTRGELALESSRYPFANVQKAHADVAARTTIGKVVRVM